MNEIGKIIVETENQKRNLEKLAAQRELYSRAKTTFGWQIFLAVPVTLALALANLYLERELDVNIEWAVAGYAVLLLMMDSLFLNKVIASRKEKAAKIQELFDCEVLRIKWNKYLISEKPDHEDIVKYYNLRIKRTKKGQFENWYAEGIQKIETNVAKLICQRSNILYDFALREKFLIWIVSIGVLVLIALSALALVKDLSFRSYVINALTPFLPVFALALKLHHENRQSIQNLLSAKATIQQVWSEVLESPGKDEVDELAIRGIQDRIYFNRKDNALIPDFIYNSLRKNLEEQMYFSVDELILEYEKASKM
jgi:hypothetical protein